MNNTNQHCNISCCDECIEALYDKVPTPNYGCTNKDCNCHHPENMFPKPILNIYGKDRDRRLRIDDFVINGHIAQGYNQALRDVVAATHQYLDKVGPKLYPHNPTLDKTEQANMRDNTYMHFVDGFNDLKDHLKLNFLPKDI